MNIEFYKKTISLWMNKFICADVRQFGMTNILIILLAPRESPNL
jgi:hypothetical protein